MYSHFTCQYCDYEAPKLSELDSLFKHTQSQLAELESHLKEEHGDRVKLGSCDQCHFTADHKATFETHMKSVHDIKCDLCSYVGKTTKHLRIHIHFTHKGT